MLNILQAFQPSANLWYFWSRSDADDDAASRRLWRHHDDQRDEPDHGHVHRDEAQGIDREEGGDGEVEQREDRVDLEEQLARVSASEEQAAKKKKRLVAFSWPGGQQGGQQGGAHLSCSCKVKHSVQAEEKKGKSREKRSVSLYSYSPWLTNNVKANLDSTSNPQTNTQNIYNLTLPQLKNPLPKIKPYSLTDPILTLPKALFARFLMSSPRTSTATTGWRSRRQWTPSNGDLASNLCLEVSVRTTSTLQGIAVPARDSDLTLMFSLFRECSCGSSRCAFNGAYANIGPGLLPGLPSRMRILTCLAPNDEDAVRRAFRTFWFSKVQLPHNRWGSSPMSCCTTWVIHSLELSPHWHQV